MARPKQTEIREAYCGECEQNSLVNGNLKCGFCDSDSVRWDLQRQNELRNKNIDATQTATLYIVTTAHDRILV